MNIPAIIVHGGAGKWDDERIPIGMEYVEKAAKVGFKVLKHGGSSIDAAEVCTTFMESCGQLNAGIGARANKNGERELDAMIMDGHSLEFGSVAAVIGIQNPTSLARYIMEKTEYAFFSGENALSLHRQMIEEGYRMEIDDRISYETDSNDTIDTVGCVVIDDRGHIATTSSTGGIRDKLPGRIGDSPVIGSGAYANDICGVTATGWGEHIMRVTLSRLIVFFIENGDEVQKATEKGMRIFQEKTGSEAGVIGLDREGNFGKTTNAKAMPTTVIQGNIDNIRIYEK